MARRPPARVRADSPRRRTAGERVPTLSGLSPRGLASLVRLERTRLWPGAAAEALRAWEAFVRHPFHRLWDPASGCGVLQCCPDPDELRHVLDLVAHALPAEDARAFRERVAAAAELW
ncbi:hypothetical protein [Amycolatopsis eburnea]|uniref:hypothetical protein n=1 Tax=Amycolatopsis eburnea TaxID=2267691 RepID=UPI001CDD4CA3|nr:hypothetical protein [Amycolatopsis eburnea]